MSFFAKFKGHRRIRARIATVSLGALLFSGGSAVLTAAPALASGCPAPAQPSGQGSTLEPYIIDSTTELAWIAGRDFSPNGNVLRLLSSNDDAALAARMGANYRQIADIDMSAYLAACERWLSIGSLTDSAGDVRVRFTGVYDGGNFAIRSFSTDNNRSLFEDIRSAGDTVAQVKNLRLVGVNVTGFDRRGILAREIQSARIENVHIAGEMKLGNPSAGAFANKVEGSSVIEGSSSHLIVSSTSDVRRGNFGGIANELLGTSRILSSSSTGSYTQMASNIGGLVGNSNSQSTLISRSWSSASIDASGNNVGGLVGDAGGPIRYSYATGNITTTTDRAGGLVGLLSGSVSNPARIFDSYARGQVTLNGANGRSGGLIGDLRGFTRGVENSFSTQAPTGLVSTNMGAFAGNQGLADADFNTVPNPSLALLENVRANFFDNSLSGNPGGLLGVANTINRDVEGAAGRVTGLPTAQLQSFATFDTAGWAIVDGWEPFNAPDDGNVDQGTHQVWGICSGVNDGYPFLLWEYTSSPCNSSSPGSSASPGVVSPAIHLDLKAKAGDVVAGAPVLIEGQGLKPGSTYSLVVRSTPTTVTTGTVSSGGRFSTTVNLPAGIAPGNHTITLTATGSNGSTLSLVTTFVVSGTGTFTSISPGAGSVVGGLAATGPDSSALSLGVASSLALLALGFTAFASSRRKTAQVS